MACVLEDVRIAVSDESQHLLRLLGPRRQQRVVDASCIYDAQVRVGLHRRVPCGSRITPTIILSIGIWVSRSTTNMSDRMTVRHRWTKDRSWRICSGPKMIACPCWESMELGTC